MNLTPIKKNEAVLLPEKWLIILSAEGSLSLTDNDGNPAVSLVYEKDAVTAILSYIPDSPSPVYENSPIVLTGKGKGIVRLAYTGNRAALYCGDVLLDEDWPLGHLHSEVICGEMSGEVTLTDDLSFDSAYVERGENHTFTDIEAFHPVGDNTSIGDCMPFTDPRDGTYRLFYLYDRRHHRSKYRFGAHQWGQVSTQDGVNWQTHPLALKIDEQWEGSICTGSIIEKDGRFYAFYAVRMSDRSPAKLTWAVSDDCVSFKKSGKYFSLAEPYEPISARDPKLFRTEDGVFHMLVTTSCGENGALAHLTSFDLENWNQESPFYVIDYAEQPECADYFSFGGRYYLVFSLHGAARYRVSDNPLAGWQKPEGSDIIVDPAFRVPKAAMLGDKLIFSGFVVEEGVDYGGHVELYEAIQNPDGSLAYRKYGKE